jgi:hypothetical protein
MIERLQEKINADKLFQYQFTKDHGRMVRVVEKATGEVEVALGDRDAEVEGSEELANDEVAARKQRAKEKLVEMKKQSEKEVAEKKEQKAKERAKKTKKKEKKSEEEGAKKNIEGGGEAIGTDENAAEKGEVGVENGGDENAAADA